MEDNPESNASRADGIGGLSIIACFVICVLGLVFAVASCFEDIDLTDAGLCLIGPAIAMGLLAASFVRR